MAGFHPSARGWATFVVVLIFILIIEVIVIFFVVMLKRIGGVGSPMSFGRSKGRLYAQEDLGVTFDDVAGIDEAVEEVREVVDFLERDIPDIFAMVITFIGSLVMLFLFDWHIASAALLLLIPVLGRPVQSVRS